MSKCACTVDISARVCVCVCVCVYAPSLRKVRPQRPSSLAAFLHRMCVCFHVCVTPHVHIETGSGGAMYYSYEGWRWG